MRIEVLVGSEDPIVFPLKAPKMTIGSGESCDVILSANGISRKHLVILSEDDKFYVADQGSTNGSFINEERLVPGRKVEFTSFFPVRLGDNVLVSLLSDEEALGEYFSEDIPKEIVPPKPQSDATSVISLKDLKKARTQDLVLERNQKREVRKKTASTKAPVKKKKDSTSFTTWMALLVMASAVYYKFFYQNDVKEIKVEKTELKKPVPRVIEKKPEGPPATIAFEDLPTKEFMNGLVDNLKCTIDIEIYFCRSIFGARGGSFGATQVGLSTYILIDGTIFYDLAKKAIESTDPEVIKQAAAFIFLTRAVPKFREESILENNVFVGLMLKNENEFYTDTIIAFRPGTLNKNKSYFQETLLRYVKIKGLKTFDGSKNIYTAY